MSGRPVRMPALAEPARVRALPERTGATVCSHRPATPMPCGKTQGWSVRTCAALESAVACVSPDRSSAMGFSPNSAMPPAPGRFREQLAHPFVTRAAARLARPGPSNATLSSRRPAMPPEHGRTREARAPMCARRASVVESANPHLCSATSCSRRPAMPLAPGATREPPAHFCAKPASVPGPASQTR